MASRHKIAETLNETRMGDVEKYFLGLNSMIEENSGNHDFKIISTDCYANSAPIINEGHTKFALTDSAIDITDISKGYINMKLEMDIQYVFTNLNDTAGHLSAVDAANNQNRLYFFIGFKSGAQFIKQYKIFSNGRLTACKNTEAKYEQTIVYNSKAKEEIISRPGVYSPHENVMKMSNCVCGIYDYITITSDIATPETKHIEIDLCIQIDDFLFASGFKYIPNCVTGSLEMEIAGTLYQNMVFCPIPHDVAMEHNGITIDPTNIVDREMLSRYQAFNDYCKQNTDFRFTQCSDYAKISFPYVTTLGDSDGDNTNTKIKAVGLFKNAYVTINPSNIYIREAKSYIHGFNIKDSVKQKLQNYLSSQPLVIASQHCEWYALAQLPTTTQIRANIQVPMSNVSQLIFTFPNSPNALTVCRQPHLENITVHVADRIVPDKALSTLDNAFSEMTMNALGLDSLFSATPELIEALNNDRGEVGTWSLLKHSDDNFGLYICLEREGSGVIDGMSGLNVPINLNANFMYGTKNPHYYQVSNENGTTIKHCPFNINMFVLSDSFWKLSSEGLEYIANGDF